MAMHTPADPFHPLTPPDMQLLANLLGNLLAALQRTPMAASPTAVPPITVPPITVPPITVPSWPQSALPPADPAQAERLQIDRAAGLALAQDVTADALRRLSAFCEQAATQHPPLDPCIGIVTEAARRFAAGDYNATLGLIWEAYRLIAAARAAHPDIPSPHERVAAPSLPH